MKVRGFRGQTGRHQGGYTVVELMVAGVLGLVLLAGIGQLFLGSSSTFRMQRQVADIQDSGRFAAWLLKSDIERAGWVETNQPVGSNGSIEIVDGADGGDAENDILTVVYDGTVDCNGNDSEDETIVRNQYSVDENGQLMCLGNGSDTPQPLLSNVDNFQVLYGIDVSNPPEPVAADICADRAADQFVVASDIPADAVVVAVRFSLLIGSDPSNSVPVADRPYQVADQVVTLTDNILRRVFTLTVPVQNAPRAPGPCPKVS